MINELYIGKDVERRDRGLLLVHIPMFAESTEETTTMMMMMLYSLLLNGLLKTYFL